MTIMSFAILFSIYFYHFCLFLIIKNILNIEQKLLKIYTALDLNLIHLINLQLIDFDFFSFFLDIFFTHYIQKNNV